MAVGISSIGISAALAGVIDGGVVVSGQEDINAQALPPIGQDATSQKMNDFAVKQPHILFISDYVVGDKSLGGLICFERYFDATHYEVYKKNKFDNEPKFERILYLGAKDLTDETKRFLPYVRDLVGFDLDETSVFIVFDDRIKQDRIYQFRVRATFVPQKAEDVKYAIIMKSKDMLNVVEVGENQRSFDLALSLLGAKQLAWIIAILNPKVLFFGKAAKTAKIFSSQKIVYVPKNNDDLAKVINEAIYLFGAKNALVHLLSAVGNSETGLGFLNKDIEQTFIESIDETKGVFSIDFFKKTLKARSSIFSLLTSVSIDEAIRQAYGLTSTTEVDKIIDDARDELPTESGDVPFGTLENFTTILNYIRKIDYAITYTQDHLEAEEAKNEALIESLAENSGIFSSAIDAMKGE